MAAPPSLRVHHHILETFQPPRCLFLYNPARCPFLYTLAIPLPAMANTSGECRVEPLIPLRKKAPKRAYDGTVRGFNRVFVKTVSVHLKLGEG